MTNYRYDDKINIMAYKKSDKYFREYLVFKKPINGVMKKSFCSISLDRFVSGIKGSESRI